MKVDIYNIEGKKLREVELPASVFEAAVNMDLMHQAYTRQMANARLGTHDTKTRSEVSGGGRKPWKQKGTGRARQGSTRAPHWRGGGVVFGPQPRSHAFKLPKSIRRAALKSALSRRLSESALTVLDGLALPEARTRHFKKFMDAFGFESLLVVVPEADVAVSLASRNIPGVTVLPVVGLNVYDILRHRNIALTTPAIAPIVARLTR